MSARDSSADAIIKDAKSVQAAYKKNSTAFKAADAKREKKLLPAELLAAHAKAITDAEHDKGKVAAGGTTVAVASADEVKARNTLFDELTAIRTEIELAYPEDKAIQKVFGRGRRMTKGSTSAVITSADALVDAFGDEEHPDYQAQGVSAGISVARIAKVAEMRATLADADSTQDSETKNRKGNSKSKSTALARLVKSTAHIRKAAGVVLRKSPEKLAQFETTRPKLAPSQKKPRKPKTA